MFRNVTNASGAGDANRMASYAGIWRFLDYFLFESDCFFGTREPRAGHSSWRRDSTVEDDYIVNRWFNSPHG
jgi:hypothetical protein